jgi:hypothetical protein
MPPDNGTRVPGGDGPGGPGEDVDGYCSRPVNPWSIAWWIDYEFCRLEWAVSLHPYHAVTMAAVPTRYATYAIMRQANEMQQELNQVKTEVAVYDFDTVTIGSQPDSETFQPDSSSPWNGGRWSLHSDQSMPMSYTGYCSAAIRDVVGTRVMDGFCFALNVMREKKLLWIFQAVINVVSIAIIGDSIAKILRVRAKGE